MITLQMTFIPNEWIDDMEKAMDGVKGALILERHPQGGTYTNLIIGIDDYIDLYLIGLYAGLNKMKEGVDEAIPEVAKNMQEYIGKIINPSKN